MLNGLSYLNFVPLNLTVLICVSKIGWQQERYEPIQMTPKEL